MFNPDDDSTAEQNEILRQIVEAKESNLTEKSLWKSLIDKLHETIPGHYGCQFYCEPWRIELYGSKLFIDKMTPAEMESEAKELEEFLKNTSPFKFHIRRCQERKKD